MAKLSANSIEMFGGTQVEEVIKGLLSRVMGSSRKYYAFKKWSTLDHGQILEALTAGSGPDVDCMNTDGRNSGCFKIAESTKVNIFRFDMQNIISPETSEMQRARKIVDFEKTLLHELVHWGREKNKQEHVKFSWINGKLIENSLGDIDAGWRFEMDAYPINFNMAYMPVTILADGL